MMYKPGELTKWWDGLSKQDHIEVLATMVDKMREPSFALSLSRQYDEGRVFSEPQLAAIRKWHRD